MEVKELIAKLRELPANAEVFLYTDEEGEPVYSRAVGVGLDVDGSVAIWDESGEGQFGR